MAFFVPGMKCVLCGLPIGIEHERVLFSPFVANRRDPLYLFSDAVLHRACFEGHRLSELALRRQEEVLQHQSSGQRRCIVCGDAITAPDDYFGTGLLTDDPMSTVFEFNYVQMHRSHFTAWQRAADFKHRMTEFLSSDAWEGPQLKFDPLPRWMTAPHLLRQTSSRS